MKLYLFLTSLAAAVALAISTQALAESERVINVSLPLGPDSQQGIGVLKFGEELERLSDGRLTIEPHYDNALGAEREVVEGMGFGIIDAGISSTGPMGASSTNLCS
ncbi:hypothetical protein [Marinobacter sp. M1C]|nr:hypothetical protein [Marinobacter sp. M1C]UQG68442.1 hypothetical protein MIH19_18485 [Marinobacter sp. M1C]